MTSVADLVESLVTGDAASPALRQAALRLAGDGAVRLDRFERLRVTAAVDDGGVCQVELAATRDGLHGHCECDGDADGHPCVHVLAAAFETWHRTLKRRR